MEFLPVELWMKVCEFLEKESLFSLASTSKEWRDMILKAPVLMRKFKYKFTNPVTDSNYLKIFKFFLVIWVCDKNE